MTTVTVNPATGNIIDIDGDLPAERAVVPVTPEPVGLARAADPSDMIALASRMATALRDIVERQQLFAVINGKRYPTVEAWAIIARMDNVVAREVAAVRHDDGSYEAAVELLRLGDLAVIGRASALCGAADDRPWSSRPEYARRSMAVTRATSRAFRQHYSWVMSLAGYEATPAEEMPPHDEPAPRHEDRAGPRTPPAASPAAGGSSVTGTVGLGAPPVDGEPRQSPEGDMVVGFVVTDSRGKRCQVLATGALAETIRKHVGGWVGSEVEAIGELVRIPWEKDGKQMPPYARLNAVTVEVL